MAAQPVKIWAMPKEVVYQFKSLEAENCINFQSPLTAVSELLDHHIRKGESIVVIKSIGGGDS